MGECVQIPFSEDLLEQVCQHLDAIAPEKRHRTRILLPHRRACRRLRELLITRHNTLLLPRIMPLGEPDLAEFAVDNTQGDTPPRQVVSAFARTGILLALLGAARARDGTVGTLEQDYIQAESLGRTLDRLQEFDLDLAALKAPEYADYAAHWERSAKFLRIVQEFWPNWCAEQQCQDPIAQRNAALRALAGNLGDAPIIIAGSSGRANAVQDLMRAVLSHSRGAVFLQGTELLTSSAEIARIAQTPSHPAHALARLWKALDLGAPQSDDTLPAEARFYRAAFRVRGQEATLAPLPKNLRGMVLPEGQDEVAATALLAREAFAMNPSAQVAVIATDDAFQLALERGLARWNIALDRAAGVPLGDTAEGRLARLLLEIFRDGLDAVRFFALLKHPLVVLGRTRKDIWRDIAALEQRFLGEGYDQQALADIAANIAEYSWLNPIKKLFEKFENQIFVNFYGIYTALFQSCVRDAQQLVPDSLAYQAIQQFWQSIAKEMAHLPLGEISAADFATLILHGLKKQRLPSQVRGTHRVQVLSPMEARLMRFDRVIIPLMAHDAMPSPVPAEPWMTRVQYKECGIPEPEEVIGLAAHDFIQLCHQNEVFLLRAEKSGDQLVAASSWWERIHAMAVAHDGRGLVDKAENARLLAWVRVLSAAVANPSNGKPEANPAVEYRPKRLSVTQIATFLVNPYETYVTKVLRLHPLPLRAEDQNAFRRGTLFHRLVQEYVEQNIASQPAPEDWLRSRATELLKGARFSALERFSLHYALQRMIAKFITADRALPMGANIVECKGEWTLDEMVISGIADRFVETPNGWMLWDYKTGRPPSKIEVKERFAWQLPILALMGRHGAFPKLNGKEVTALAYWQISGGKADGWRAIYGAEDIDALREKLRDIEDHLRKLFQDFRDAATPYPAADQLPKYCNVEHLMRAEEWQKQLSIEAEDA